MTTKWFEYVKSCYELVAETEERINIKLDQDVEAYVVHLMANNFERTDIGEKIISIQLLEATQRRDRELYRILGDECLLIHSYPMKRQRWSSPTYYLDMGLIAYGFADHIMEEHFFPASVVISAIFNRRPYI